MPVPNRNAAIRVRPASAPKTRFVPIATLLSSIELTLRAVARLSVRICRFWISVRRGWNKVLLNLRIRMAAADGKARRAIARVRQEAAAMPQKSSRELQIPSRSVTEEEQNPKSPSRVAATRGVR